MQVKYPRHSMFMLHHIVNFTAVCKRNIYWRQCLAFQRQPNFFFFIHIYILSQCCMENLSQRLDLVVTLLVLMLS